jgi:DNA-3-methyladenine glycosylase
LILSRILTKAYYLDEDVVSLARGLLGKIIVSRADSVYSALIITETEAYKGPEDKASHAYNNRLTERTRPMFAEGGISYVYLCYGIHRLFNVVSGPANTPHAVLIRAGVPLEGIETMIQRRNGLRETNKIASGPGNLTKSLGITLKHNNKALFDKRSIITIEDWGHSFKNIFSSPRVGIDYAEDWKDMPWRFHVENNNFPKEFKNNNYDER